jgi:hypothetical protein
MNLPFGPVRKTALVAVIAVAALAIVLPAHPQNLPSGSWILLPAPPCPSPANQTFLNAVSWLPNAKVGFAAGSCRQDPDTYSPLVYRITPQSGARRMPVYGSSLDAQTILNAVSADSPADIWVAGYSQTPARTVVNVQRSMGLVFQQIACPNAGNRQNIAYGVMAFAPNNVYVAGAYNDSGGPGLTYFAHWDGKSCTQIPSPNPSSFNNAFFAIGGSSPQDIWLVGDDYDTNLGIWAPLCIHYDGMVFEQYTCPLGVNGGLIINELVNVSAIAGGYAWAVGNESDYGSFDGLDEYFSNGSWQLALGPQGTCFTSVYREWGVTGVSPNFAWQVAECQGDSRIAFWDGQMWNAFPKPTLPPETNFNVLYGVSASDTHTALAVGNYNIGQGPQLPLVTLYTDNDASTAPPSSNQ